MKNIFKNTSMNIREFFPNDNDFNKLIPENDRAEVSQTKKILGINWNPLTDSIGIVLKPWDSSVLTKRTILQFIASQYDLLGLLIPSMLLFKLFLQTLWKKKLSWDQSLENDDIETWGVLTSQWPTKVKDVPRCVIDPDRLQQLEIHVFTDAAPVAYAAAVYAKQGTNRFLIFAKSQIAPVKGITIPKLELLAILIGVRATRFIVKQLEIEDVRVTLWSDSQCALQWIRNRSRLLPKFIQNRMDEIRMSKISYRYIPSRFNPADIATKGYMSPTQLANFEQWWTGPQWLKDDESTWPQWGNNIYHEHEEHETKICIATTITKTVSIKSFRLVDATRISKWTKLKRTAAWALRFIRYMSKEGRFKWLKEVPEETELTSYELAEATKILIMHVLRRFSARRGILD
uniref:Pao retrotransposon peptidase n=1 Tax=Loa loa TaxID=7209 RepID=A0A1I7VBA3_LOALO